MNPVLRWIDDHDESWLFFFLYLGASIFLSVFFNLGFFLILIFVHFLLDFLKHWNSNNRVTNSMPHAFFYALRDGFLLDFFLFLVAFGYGYVFALTFAAGFSRGVKLLRAIEVQSLLRAVPRFILADWLVQNIANLTVYLHEHDKRKVYMPIHFRMVEKALILGSIVTLVIISFLPVITQHEYSTLVEYARSELIPNVVLWL